MGERGTDLHDRASIARQHSFERLQSAKFYRLHLLHGRKDGGHRVVDPDMDRSQLSFDFLRGGFDLIGLSHIHRHDKRLATIALTVRSRPVPSRRLRERLGRHAHAPRRIFSRPRGRRRPMHR